MNQSEFKSLYDNYNTFTKRTMLFRIQGCSWDDQVNKWVTYRDIILNGGLPIDRWLKNEKDGYLPDFLEKKEKNFGSSNPGTMEYNMIYHNTKRGNPNYDKFYNAYKGNQYFDKKEDVEEDYNTYIKPLISDIVKAEDLNSLYEIEKSEKYIKYSAKQILRKISVMMSLTEDSKYKNAFVWIYEETRLAKLANLLNIDYDENKTFLENNHLIYEKAKEYAELDNNSSKDEYIKLYDFLLFIMDDSLNTSELCDFNSINIIFNGAPGTGKTYAVTKGIEKLQAINSGTYSESKYIQFHPSFSYQDFIEGIKPIGISNGNLNLQVVNGVFKKFCIDVKKKNEEFWRNLDNNKKPDPQKPEQFNNWPHYFFVVDEINRGNLSTIFGETFTLLEADYRDYDFSGTYNKKATNLISTALSNVISNLDDEKSESLIYKKVGDEVCFGIPFNIHFIGIMNDVDRSIDAFDLALRRRFKWITKSCDYNVIQSVLTANGYKEDDVSDYVASCKKLNDMICDTTKDGLKLGKTYEIGHAFFLKIRNTGGNKTITKDKKLTVFNAYISGTIREYIRQIAEENEIDAWIEKAKKAFGI